MSIIRTTLHLKRVSDSVTQFTYNATVLRSIHYYALVPFFSLAAISAAHTRPLIEEIDFQCTASCIFLRLFLAMHWQRECVHNLKLSVVSVLLMPEQPLKFKLTLLLILLELKSFIGYNLLSAL